MSTIKLSAGSVVVADNWDTDCLPSIREITDSIGGVVRAAAGEMLKYAFVEHTLLVVLDDDEIGRIEISVDEDAGIGALEWKIDLCALVEDFIGMTSREGRVAMRDLLRAQADEIDKRLEDQK